ncbi:cytochrome c oxidase subunit II [Mucilaginibacter sp. HMF5004]|uniref:cytochrome c oxidase subunit II n=1 Tax=Mucilaginibacter rivuli TaxID=2857527 RepID=UPI001C5D6F97|nr:cytochrome c oxidase subunit II [Mucilaginibacter rivuli]MBW4890283.1 cytochrome c oxidase subunit II [Mucilaginibacter rivuli]
MAFKNIFKFKTLSTAVAAMLLFATTTVMAEAPAAAAATADDASTTMWTGVGYYVLLFVLLATIVGIVGKILRVYDLTAQIQGKKAINWNNIMGVLCIVFLLAGLYGSYWEFTEQGTMSLPAAASIHGVDLDNMFSVTFIITVIVFFLTQICLFWFLFKYRGSDKRKAYFYPHNNTIEKIWTVIPAIVLTVLVITGFFTWKKITNTTEVKGDINIDVTGHQFAWELRYPGKDGKLGTKDYKLTTGTNKVGVDFKDKNSLDDQIADTLVVPVHKSIRLNIIAQDVIHSVYMPHFRVQINAVPGLPTYFKFTPTLTTNEMRAKVEDPKFEYLLYCNKICGGGHYNMQKVVRVVSQAEYDGWVAAQKPYFNDALKKELKMADAKQPKALGQNRLALNN